MDQWKKVAWSDEPFFLDQVDGQMRVSFMGKGWQQDALWEKGRQTEAVFCSGQCSTGNLDC